MLQEQYCEDVLMSRETSSLMRESDITTIFVDPDNYDNYDLDGQGYNADLVLDEEINFYTFPK